jgi:hypothetical protein
MGAKYASLFAYFGMVLTGDRTKGIRKDDLVLTSRDERNPRTTLCLTATTALSVWPRQEHVRADAIASRRKRSVKVEHR